MEENILLISCNSQKMDLISIKTCDNCAKKFENNNEIVIKSKESNTSSLFSEDNDDSKQTNLLEGYEISKHHLGSMSPVKRLYPEHLTPFSNESTSYIHNETRLKHSSSVAKKVERCRPNIPPPLSLYPKSQLPEEPLRSGGNIIFMKSIHSKGCNDVEIKSNTKEDAKVIEGMTDKIKEIEETENLKGKRNFKTMFFKELRGCERNPIVFSRYSQTSYDPNEKLPEDFQLSCIINLK